MSRTVAKDNPRERELRSALHRHGFRFRVHHMGVTGTGRTIDIAFTRLRVAVFCDGCFWHGCPIHATTPKTNQDWWIAKINANIKRDRDTDERLAAEKWIVLRIWGHVPVDEAMSMILLNLSALTQKHRLPMQPAHSPADQQ